MIDLRKRPSRTLHASVLLILLSLVGPPSTADGQAAAALRLIAGGSRAANQVSLGLRSHSSVLSGSSPLWSGGRVVGGDLARSLAANNRWLAISHGLNFETDNLTDNQRLLLKFEDAQQSASRQLEARDRCESLAAQAGIESALLCARLRPAFIDFGLWGGQYDREPASQSSAATQLRMAMVAAKAPRSPRAESRATALSAEEIHEIFSDSFRLGLFEHSYWNLNGVLHLHSARYESLGDLVKDPTTPIEEKADILVLLIEKLPAKGGQRERIETFAGHLRNLVAARRAGDRQNPQTLVMKEFLGAPRYRPTRPNPSPAAPISDLLLETAKGLELDAFLISRAESHGEKLQRELGGDLFGPKARRLIEQRNPKVLDSLLRLMIGVGATNTALSWKSSELLIREWLAISLGVDAVEASTRFESLVSCGVLAPSFKHG